MRRRMRSSTGCDEILPDLVEPYQQLLNTVFALGIMTRQEYETQWKGRYVNPDLGTDSFMGYIESVVCKIECYSTSNANMIRDAKKLEARFGVKING